MAERLAAVRAEWGRRAAEREREQLDRHADEIRDRCKTLRGFVGEAWHVLEPIARFSPNWHVDAVCEHLEAVSNEQINRLLINIWPGSMKSLLVSVLWNAWEWGPRGMPSMRHLSTSYTDKPITRDCRKTRDLILSEWYQTLWPAVRLVRTGETSFANDQTGTREGAAFGSLTNQRGDRFNLDDPHSTETAESDAERETATRKFREGALNRLNDEQRSAIVVMMQRLHAKDISGVILELGMPFVHLMLPIEFEPDRRCVTSIGFRDPRTNDGELADPKRFPPSIIEHKKKNMGAYAYAGQYQQRPSARAGNMFKRAWFADKMIRKDAIPANTRWVRHWDLAGSTKKTSPFTAGVKLGVTPDRRFIVADVRRERVESADMRKLIRLTAQLDGLRVYVQIPQDPGQAGKDQAKDIVSNELAGFNAHKMIETGDKEQRAEPFSAQCENGNVYYVEGDWNEAYIDELCEFPNGKFADQVDASANAFSRLMTIAPPPPPATTIAPVVIRTSNPLFPDVG